MDTIFSIYSETIKAIRHFDNIGLPEAVKKYDSLTDDKKMEYFERYDRYKTTLIRNKRKRR